MSATQTPNVIFDSPVEVIPARSPPEVGDWRAELRRSGDETLLTGWLVSAILHVAAVLVLTALLMPAHPGESGVLVADMTLSESEQTPLETFTVLEEVGGVEFVGPEDDTFSELVDETMMAIADPFAGDASGDGPNRSQSASAGPRGGSGGRSGPRADFFGTVAQGDRFVYVVDISGSMSKGVRNTQREGCRFDRAAAELLRSIDQLRDDQYFYVILFASKTRQMFDGESSLPQMVPATYENKRRLKTWLEGVTPDGGTDPREALLLGLRMNPSAVFLLSDGKFNGRSSRGVLKGNPEVSEVVKKNNSAKSPIHTFAYEDKTGRDNMYKLSTQTSGVYRFVPPSSGGEVLKPPPKPPPKPPSDPSQRAETLLRLADRLESSGKLPEAMRRYRKIVDEFPKTDAAVEARKRIVRR